MELRPRDHHGRAIIGHNYRPFLQRVNNAAAAGAAAAVGHYAHQAANNLAEQGVNAVANAGRSFRDWLLTPDNTVVEQPRASTPIDGGTHQVQERPDESSIDYDNVDGDEMGDDTGNSGNSGESERTPRDTPNASMNSSAGSAGGTQGVGVAQQFAPPLGPTEEIASFRFRKTYEHVVSFQNDEYFRIVSDASKEDPSQANVSNAKNCSFETNWCVIPYQYRQCCKNQRIWKQMITNCSKIRCESAGFRISNIRFLKDKQVNLAGSVSTVTEPYDGGQLYFLFDVNRQTHTRAVTTDRDQCIAWCNLNHNWRKRSDCTREEMTLGKFHPPLILNKNYLTKTFATPRIANGATLPLSEINDVYSNGHVKILTKGDIVEQSWENKCKLWEIIQNFSFGTGFSQRIGIDNMGVAQAGPLVSNFSWHKNSRMRWQSDEGAGSSPEETGRHHQRRNQPYIVKESGNAHYGKRRAQFMEQFRHATTTQQYYHNEPPPFALVQIPKTNDHANNHIGYYCQFTIEYTQDWTGVTKSAGDSQMMPVYVDDLTYYGTDDDYRDFGMLASFDRSMDPANSSYFTPNMEFQPTLS